MPRAAHAARGAILPPLYASKRLAAGYRAGAAACRYAEPDPNAKHMVFYHLFKPVFASTVRRVSVGMADLLKGGIA